MTRTIARGEIARRLEAGEPTVIVETLRTEHFEQGHLPGAVSLPIEELPSQLDDLPRARRIVAYCRGAYCLFADEAVALLRRHGFDAIRLDGGWPEWLSEGRPTAGVGPSAVPGA